MVAVFWMAGIFGGIELWISYRKKQEGAERYSGIACVAGFLITRAVLYLMQEQPVTGLWQSFLIDALVFACLVFVIKEQDSTLKWEYIWLHLSNPIVLVCLFSVKKISILALAVLALIVAIKTGKFRRFEQHILELYRYNMAFTLCILAYLASRMLLGQSGSQCAAGDANVPVLWILSIAAGILVLAHFLYHVMGWLKEEEGQLPPSSNVQREKEREKCQRDTFDGRDVVWLLLLTGAFAVMAFFRLGSMEAPQSFIEFNDKEAKNREMVLELGKDTYVSEIQIFLGAESKRSFSFSYFDKEESKWQVFDSKRNIESVFQWNRVEVNRTIERLGIVSMDSHAYVNEIVILDAEGNRILPVNASYYVNAFDEQELFPEHVTYLDGTMFDEVYHARTAYEFVHQLPIYEITHPPLGKLLISIGIRLFGMTPFGFRVICALCGTAMVPFVYLFAREFSGRRKIAVFTAAVLNLEFMHLTLSRIATLDIIVAAFVLPMFYFMYLAIKELRRTGLGVKAVGYLIACGCFSACAVASKWTGFYALAGIAVLFLGFLIQEYIGDWKKIIRERGYLLRLLVVCVISFILIPGAVYFLSYIPYTWSGNPDSFIKITIDNFKQMLSYHEKTVFEHPYSSEWYEWIWNKRPLLDALDDLPGNKVSSVATFGNPVIWWGGMAALLHNIYLWRCRKDKTAAYLCIAYLAMLLPWVFIHRTVFIYQYFISSNILVLLLGNSFAHIQRKQREAAAGFLLAAGVVFLMFYPVLTGYPVSRDYINQGLEWLRSWGLA